MRTIANVVKELREAMLMTQKEFGILLGVVSVSVSRWENGHSIPTISQKRKLRDLCSKYCVLWIDNK